MKCFVNKSGTIGYYICFTPFPLHSNSQNTNQINSLINQIEFTFSLTSHIIILFSFTIQFQSSLNFQLARFFAFSRPLIKSRFAAASTTGLIHKKKQQIHTSQSTNHIYLPRRVA